jgi:hypothetical protein
MLGCSSFKCTRRHLLPAGVAIGSFAVGTFASGLRSPAWFRSSAEGREAGEAGLPAVGGQASASVPLGWMTWTSAAK